MKKRWISSAHYGVTTSSRRHFLLRADSSLHRSPCPPPPSRPPCSPSLSSSSPLCPLRSLRAGDLDLAKKKSETASSVTPAGAGHKRFPKHFRRLTLGINKQSERPGVRNEEPTLATSGRSRRLTAASRDAAIARALTPPLDGGGRRGPRGRFSLALFLLLEDKASKVVSCGLPTRVWGQLTGRF